MWIPHTSSTRDSVYQWESGKLFRSAEIKRRTLFIIFKLITNHFATFYKLTIVSSNMTALTNKSTGRFSQLAQKNLACNFLSHIHSPWYLSSSIFLNWFLLHVLQYACSIPIDGGGILMGQNARSTSCCLFLCPVSFTFPNHESPTGLHPHSPKMQEHPCIYRCRWSLHDHIVVLTLKTSKFYFFLTPHFFFNFW